MTISVLLLLSYLRSATSFTSLPGLMLNPKLAQISPKQITVKETGEIA